MKTYRELLNELIGVHNPKTNIAYRKKARKSVDKMERSISINMKQHLGDMFRTTHPGKIYKKWANAKTKSERDRIGHESDQIARKAQRRRVGISRAWDRS